MARGSLKVEEAASCLRYDDVDFFVIKQVSVKSAKDQIPLENKGPVHKLWEDLALYNINEFIVFCFIIRYFT